jgi:hypothetical protein
MHVPSWPLTAPEKKNGEVLDDLYEPFEVEKLAGVRTTFPTCTPEHTEQD